MVTLEWATTGVDFGILKTCSAIVMVDMQCQLLLHSLEQTLCRVSTSVGFVVVVGLFHMDMADKVLLLTNVVVAVDRVVWVVLVLLKLLTSDIIKTPCEGSERVLTAPSFLFSGINRTEGVNPNKS
tara:strand:+ start:606 stop:983 length:378 start_codon:yes stop_codon:yes gene_type:complete